MNTQTSTISKIKMLPSDMLDEVNDYIDFLLSRHKPKTDDNLNTLREKENIAEIGMENYLKNLTDYETMLAEGKLKW